MKHAFHRHIGRIMSMVRMNPGEPYNELPLLPPEADVETKATMRAAIRAHKALADLRASARALPNQGILVRAISLQEAKLSSEIEYIVTTNDEVYRAFSKDAEVTNSQTKEVLRYGDAVWAGFSRLKDGKPLDRHLFIALASEVLGVATEVRVGSGTRIGNPRTGKVVYTPPEGSALVERLLDNLARYLAKEEGVDALIKLAVAHYQFEAIHPFRDGNGRVGRILNVLYLVKRDLLDLPILYLSRAILDDKPAYYRGLREVTERGAWESWILFILEAIELTAIETRRRIESIEGLLGEALERARHEMSRGFSPELIQLAFEQPYTRIAFLEARGIAKRQTASEYLQELERIGVLRGERRGREMYYVNDRLLTALAE